MLVTAAVKAMVACLALSFRHHINHDPKKSQIYRL